MNIEFELQFVDCIAIGRDLIRLLQDVAKIPEFEELWRDLLNKPSSLAPTFNGISHLATIRTPRIYLLSRISPDMETQIMFVLKNVKMGNQKRYQLWFAQK